MGLIKRLCRIFYALDCFAFMALTLGGAYPGESFSSAAWRSEQDGGWYGRIFRPVIDALASILGDTNHCQRVYQTAWLDLPEDMRP